MMSPAVNFSLQVKKSLNTEFNYFYRTFSKPVASVRPMQSEMGSRIAQQLQNRSKWIPAEVWQKQGMSAQEMTLPLGNKK